MNRFRRPPRQLLALALLALVSACGSSSDPDAAESVDGTLVESADEVAGGGDADAAEPVDEPEPTTTTITEPSAPAGLDRFDEIVVEPTEPGRRPLLAWGAVDGAALYQLTVLDAAGEPYWSWSGADTSVHLGGMTEVDAAGPFVFEPMTWMVVARDADDRPLAVSARQSLTP